MNRKVLHGIYKKDLLKKHQEHQHQTENLQTQALREAKRLANVLVDEFQVDRVYLIGPLVYRKFTQGMRLELALEGAPQGAYARAVAHIRHISAFDVELIDLQHADSWTRRAIKKTALLAQNTET